MDAHAVVRESQKAIIERLAHCERLVATLYGSYVGLFPEMADFWRALSRQESEHELLLLSLHRQLDQNRVFYNLGRFDTRTIDQFIATVDKELAAAQGKSITVTHALSAAYSIESSLLDAHFYDIVKSDAPEFVTIAEHLSRATKTHTEQIQALILNRG